MPMNRLLLVPLILVILVPAAPAAAGSTVITDRFGRTLDEFGVILYQDRAYWIAEGR